MTRVTRELSDHRDNEAKWQPNKKATVSIKPPLFLFSQGDRFVFSLFMEMHAPFL